MATHTWKTGVTGAFTTATNWIDNTAPRPGDTAVIATGTVTVATILQSETIQFQTAINATDRAYTDALILSNTTLDANSGLFATGYNARDASLHAQAFTIATSGTLQNAGLIDIGGDSFLSALQLTLNQTDRPPAGQASIVNTGQVVVYGDSTLTIGSSAAAITVENDGTMDALASSTLNVADAPAAIGAHNTLVNNGRLIIGDTSGRAQGTIAATLTGAGEASANGDGSVLTVAGASIGAGVVARNGGTVAYTGLATAQASGGAVAFDVNGTLDLDMRNVATFDPNIVNFAAGDVIRVHTSTAVAAAVWDRVNGELNLNDGSGHTLASLFIVGLYQQSDFSTPPGPVIPTGPGYEYDITTDAPPGVTAPPPCFVSGTLIQTPAGPVPVETIQPGDTILTAEGRCAPVRWAGRRRVVCAAHPKTADVHPVRIAAGAFGRALPRTDLWLSPDHAILFEDVLIPVRHLIDGHAVAQIDVSHVTYHHLELDRHDTLVANGLPTESFLDTGQRESFENGKVVRLHPDFSLRVWEAEGCRPLHVAGPVVDRARAKLRNVRRRKKRVA